MIDKKKTFRYMLIGHLFFWGTFGLFMAILSLLGVGIIPIGGEVQTGLDGFKWAMIVALTGGVIFAAVNYFMIEVGHKIKELLMFWKKSKKQEDEKPLKPESHKTTNDNENSNKGNHQ